MKSKLPFVKNPAKFFRLLSIWIVVLMVVFSKKTDIADQNHAPKEKKDKVAIASSEDQNANSFLFVDCTGFFE